MDLVKEGIEDLIQLKVVADDASKEFADAIKATAEKSGVLASALRRFVIARAGEKFADRKRECEQLSLLFDEIGSQ